MSEKTRRRVERETPVSSDVEMRLRIFCAIKISEDVAAIAASHIRQLQNRCANVAASWNRDTNFHLTLKFFGHTPLARIADVSNAANSTAASFSQFNIALEGAGAFPKHGPPRVLWLGIEDTEGKLSVLQKRFEAECAGLGFEREDRAFHPHLTLARLRKPEGAKALAAAHKEMGFKRIQIPVTEIVVMRSELSPKGSRYSEVSIHKLIG